MATPLDISLVPKIKDLIDKHGISATYMSESEVAEYDPTLKDPDNASHDTEVSDTIVVSTPPFAFDAADIDGTVVQVADAYVFIYDSEDFTPATDDSFIIAGQTWRVMNTEAFYTGELIAAWKLQLRKGAKRAD
jgi:hypothetical protein